MKKRTFAEFLKICYFMTMEDYYNLDELQKKAIRIAYDHSR